MEPHRSDALSHAIENITEEYWNRTSHALLASAIGKQLRRDFPDFSTIVTDGLLNFVKLKPIVQVIRHPAMSAKIGLLPLSIPVPSDVTSLFVEEAVGRTTGSFRKGLSDDFWKAFHRPLREPRYVIIDKDSNTFRISNTNRNAGITEQAYEITADDISSPPPDTPPESLAEFNRLKIWDWLSRHQLTEDQFQKHCLRMRTLPSTTMTTMPMLKPSDQKLSRLSLALSKLNDADLSRISIPLDLVLKLI